MPVKVTAQDETVTHAVLHIVDKYKFAGLASDETARRVLTEISEPGFQTPAVVLGNDLAQAIGASQIKIL
jgi:short subunit dehydrogenase-like uncharacterized protein